MSRRNHLYAKNIDYTTVEEFLDTFTGDEPIPPSMTASLKAVTAKFQTDRQYTKQSIADAVQVYYDSKGWSPAAIRNTRIAISNCSRDNSRRQYTSGWQMSQQQKDAISKALKGRHWKIVDGKRTYY